MKKLDELREKATTPLKSIKAFCYDCYGGNPSGCPSTECVLYEYRKGKGKAPTLTEEQRVAARDRLQKSRGK